MSILDNLKGPKKNLAPYSKTIDFLNPLLIYARQPILLALYLP